MAILRAIEMWDLSVCMRAKSAIGAFFAEEVACLWSPSVTGVCGVMAYLPFLLGWPCGSTVLAVAPGWPGTVHDPLGRPSVCSRPVLGTG
jgi:hypothetical protein